MSARRSMAERRTATALAGVALLLTLACGESFTHTNPYDPDLPVTITLEGPDTIFNSFEQVSYIAHADPVLPDTAFAYVSSNPVILSASQGSFFVLSTPLYPAATGIMVTIGVGAIDTVSTNVVANGPAPMVTLFRHQLSKIIYLSQRIKNIKLRCPDTHTCDPLTVGGTASVWVDATDSLGHAIQAYFSPTANSASGAPLASYSVRDPGIASVVPLGTRVGTITALKPGTTWILGTRGPLVDSMQLVVH